MLGPDDPVAFLEISFITLRSLNEKGFHKVADLASEESLRSLTGPVLTDTLAAIVKEIGIKSDRGLDR